MSECNRCNQECSLRDGMEETKYCDSCAHWRVEELEFCLRQIISDLPSKRDWLNPDIERQAKELLR